MLNERMNLNVGLLSDTDPGIDVVPTFHEVDNAKSDIDDVVFVSHVREVLALTLRDCPSFIPGFAESQPECDGIVPVVKPVVGMNLGFKMGADFCVDDVQIESIFGTGCGLGIEPNVYSHGISEGWFLG
jgi:hypothetical protein